MSQRLLFSILGPRFYYTQIITISPLVCCVFREADIALARVCGAICNSPLGPRPRLRESPGHRAAQRHQRVSPQKHHLRLSVLIFTYLSVCHFKILKMIFLPVGCLSDVTNRHKWWRKIWSLLDVWLNAEIADKGCCRAAICL